MDVLESDTIQFIFLNNSEFVRDSLKKQFVLLIARKKESHIKLTEIQKKRNIFLGIAEIFL